MLDSNPCRHPIAVLLLDGFSMLSFGSILEPFEFTNRYFPDIEAEVIIYGLNATTATSCSGVQIGCHATSLELAANATGLRSHSAIFVCGPTTRAADDPTQIMSILRGLLRSRIPLHIIGGVITAIAEIGALRGQQATLHWKNLSAFAEAYPDIETRNALYVPAARMTSCAGELATLDMVLALIAARSPEAAEAARDNFLVSFPRDCSTVQPGSQMNRALTAPGVLSVATEMMIRRMDEDISVQDLADRCEISIRQLERLFKRHFQSTPTQYWTQLRLERAFELVSQTSLSICDISAAVGFSSPSVLRRKFREFFHRSPTETRRRTSAPICFV